MRAIDADALIVQFRRAIETFLPNDPRKHMNPVDSLKCHGWEQGLMVIQDAPTIQPEPHWIPVEQALPELRHDVLLTVFFHERWNVAEGYRQDGEFMFWNNGRLDSVLDEENRVIAWTPKPEPYKGVTE